MLPLPVIFLIWLHYLSGDLCYCLCSRDVDLRFEEFVATLLHLVSSVISILVVRISLSCSSSLAMSLCEGPFLMVERPSLTSAICVWTLSILARTSLEKFANIVLSSVTSPMAAMWGSVWSLYTKWWRRGKGDGYGSG